MCEINIVLCPFLRYIYWGRAQFWIIRVFFDYVSPKLVYANPYSLHLITMTLQLQAVFSIFNIFLYFWISFHQSLQTCTDCISYYISTKPVLDLPLINPGLLNIWTEFSQSSIIYTLFWLLQSSSLGTCTSVHTWNKLPVSLL